MTGAHWGLLATAAVAAVLCLWWTRRHPRIRGVDAELATCPSGCGCRYGTNDPDRFDCACDGPCCMASDAEWFAVSRQEWSDEPGDPTHEQIDQALDLASEVDRAKADHLNAAMAAVDHPYTHPTAEEAADCTVCSPSSLPRRRGRP